MNPKKAKAISLGEARKPLGRLKKDYIAEMNAFALFLGDTPEDSTYDNALVGSVQKPGGALVACYDYDKCVECLMFPSPSFADGMAHEEAVEWMEFNVVGAYVGENGPVFFYPMPEFDL